MKFLMKSMLCSAVLVAGVAHAGVIGSVERTQYFNAPAHCQGALPSFEAALRKRPLGLQNEGTTNAFVTCAIPTQGEVEGLEVYVSTHDGSAAPVACTAVTGYKGGTNYYVTQTTNTVPEGFAGFYWDASDIVEGATVFPSGYIALSCNLAPGTGLNDFWVYYSETLS